MKCALTIILCFTIGLTLAKNYTFTYEMANLCKEHICNHGYSYETYYRVDSEDRRQIKKDPSVVFQMHIAILASSNGHILLSPVPAPTSKDSVYEIVVGGGGNKFSELRRNLRRNAKTSAKTTGILSTLEFRAFYIKITEDGIIEFGKEGDPPILQYHDIIPLDIKYFSFAAWNGVQAKFLYDCPVPGENDTLSSLTESEAVAPKLSNSDQLKYSLLLNRYPDVSPRPKMLVKMGIRVININYNAFESKLYTSLAIVTSWTDDSLAWNPDKFNGTTRVKFRSGQIWRPTFFVYNSDNADMLDTRNPEMITVVNSGEATFHFYTEIASWCFEYTETMNRWPRDEYKCSIVIQPWEAHEKIALEIMHPEDIKMAVFAGIDNLVQNEWEISAKQVVVPPLHWQEIFTANDNLTHQSDRIVIALHLQRQAVTYDIVFYTPLIVLLTFILMSFWSEPLTEARIWFYASCTCIICMGLCYIDVLVPSHTVPSILILYTTLLYSVLLALLINVIMRLNIAKKIYSSAVTHTILTSRIFRKIFCLPTMKTCMKYDTINEAYSGEDDDSSVVIAPRNGNIEEMQTENNTYGEKEELALVIDKIMFFVYSVVFAVMLGLHF